METTNEIYSDNEGVVLGENEKEAPMDDNKIVRKDTDVVLGACPSNSLKQA
jgi:hypothetical protein